ncbi:MAG: DUF3883 domain-containing protein [Burkholderiaceae bacterium]
MPELNSPGTEWTPSEIELIVTDYFHMRAKFLRGGAFVKARHYQAIMRKTGRTKGSVEAKYMNISAALERLSLPWIPGYAPLRNFQGALLRAVETFVAREWNEDIVSAAEGDVAASLAPLVITDPPRIGGETTSSNAELERLVRKFDPALRDERNRKTGLAGEKRVFDSEVARLTAAGRVDLARRVEWTSQELGDGAGYDVRSFEIDGRERFLEVKTTIGHKRTPFYLSRVERDFADEAGDRYRIVRLYEWGREPKAFLIAPPLEHTLILEPSVYRASFGG